MAPDTVAPLPGEVMTILGSPQPAGAAGTLVAVGAAVAVGSSSARVGVAVGRLGSGVAVAASVGVGSGSACG
jgi:hypothetical protein